MYLDKILGTKTKVNLLSLLVLNPEKSYLERELADTCGISRSEANRQVKDLVNAGIVEMQRFGKAKVYQINKEHFLFMPLKGLFRELTEVYMEIAKDVVDFVKGKYTLKAVILLGSLSKGTLREDLVEEPSDIDLVFVVDKDKREVLKDLTSYINSEISRKYGVVVYPIVFSVSEYVKGLKDNPLIIEAHAEGEVIYGKKPRRFG